MCAFDADLPAFVMNGEGLVLLGSDGDLDAAVCELEGGVSGGFALEDDARAWGHDDRPVAFGGDGCGGLVCLEMGRTVFLCLCGGDALESEGFEGFEIRPEEKHKSEGSDGCDACPCDAEPRPFWGCVGGSAGRGRKVLR